MTGAQAGQVALAIVAFPLTLLGMGLAGGAIFFILKKNRGQRLLIGAMILVLCSVIFYYLGVTTLVDLLSFSEKVKEGFGWSAGFFMAFTGAIVLVGTGVFYVITIKCKPATFKRIHADEPIEEDQDTEESDTAEDEEAESKPIAEPEPESEPKPTPRKITWDDSEDSEADSEE